MTDAEPAFGDRSTIDDTRSLAANRLFARRAIYIVKGGSLAAASAKCSSAWRLSTVKSVFEISTTDVQPLTLFPFYVYICIYTYSKVATYMKQICNSDVSVVMQ